MGDVDYERKFEEMQRYLPFLERVIEKLKNSDHDKPRKAQLEKMQMLHNLLNNKQKKLKVETLLKCESVLKKLHAKIDKSDELSPPKGSEKPSKVTSAPSTSSAVPTKEQPSTPISVVQSTVHVTNTSSAPRFLAKNNLIEINTCPASPTQGGEEDFRPPVEIPTERRNSPIRSLPHHHPEQKHIYKTQTEPIRAHITSGPSPQRFQNHPNDFHHNRFQHQPELMSNRSNDYHHNKFQQHPEHILDRAYHYHHNRFPYQEQKAEHLKNNFTRWSGSSERLPEPQTATMQSCNTSSHHRSWSSPSHSSSSSIGPHRPHEPKRVEQKKAYSSEEENWDEPEDEKPKPPPKPTSKPSSTLSAASAASTHSLNREQSSIHQRSIEKNTKHIRIPPPLPDRALEKDSYQKKLYHDTIFKYKKPDPPINLFNPFMNPPPPDSLAPTPPVSNIFNRLGEKVDPSYENFRIEVKNDKMKPKPAPLTPQSPPQPAPVPPVKPIDEVLKSPPLSADDIDDLLNESLEAAIGKSVKPKPIEIIKDNKSSALDLVRKKLAMISKPPQTGPASPPPANKSQEEMEPFYRRGHTPTKKKPETEEPNTSKESPQRELFKSPNTIPKNQAESSPKSPPNPIDPVIERLALKYHPHRRRESISSPSLETYNQHLKKDQSVDKLPSTKDKFMDPMTDRLALKYNPHPRRDSTVSPLRTSDPRVGKLINQLPPLVTSPLSPPPMPVPNVLPTINPYDPRLRNTRHGNMDTVPAIPFCSPIPYSSPIPSLMDIKVNPVSVTSCPPPKPLFGIPPPSRLDPRTQKLQTTVYAEKFNPERNDQTERMKYLESKKKKPPEPKTYGEYKQSRSRQAAEEAAKSNSVVSETPSVPQVVLSTAPSTLDKMYRNSDYSKELGGSIQGFKIPKKPKPEEPKKKEGDNVDKILVESEKKQEKLVNKTEEPKKKEEDNFAKILVEPEKKQEKLVNKTEEPEKKIDEPSKKEEGSIKIVQEPEDHSKKPEEPVIEKKIDKVESAKKVEKQICDTKAASKDLEEPHEQFGKTGKVQNKTADVNKDIGKDSNESEIDGIFMEDNKPIEPEPIKKPAAIRRERRKSRGSKAPPEVKDIDIPSPNAMMKPEEKSEDEIKPRRISARRLTVMKEVTTTDCEDLNESSTLISTRRRSASDLFGPTTDNSIVSTENIITGKRKTRASINFNEKATKKPATPKATPTTSPARTPKTHGKPGPKPGAKKTPPVPNRSLRRSGGRQPADDGQICAVSSTTSQGGDADDLHMNDLEAAEEIEVSEEPSSSGARAQLPVADGDENEKKQEWLEGFLKSIMDPSTNKDRILDMLKTVLDDKKLQQVKDILYSTEDEEQETTTCAKKAQEPTKPRVGRTKKNELDRLNEDIRDMFICQGVVTATGRRMCTLAKDTATVKTPPPKQKEQPKEKKTKTKSPSSATSSPTLSNKRPMRKAKVIISPLNMRALRSRAKKDNDPPQMPVLEPNTPIKLQIETENKNKKDRPMKKKPGPKSKRLPSLVLESEDEEDNIELVHLKKKIKDETKVDKEKVEVNSKQEKESTEMVEQLKPEELIKNTNPEWHTMSDYAGCCVICKEKARFVAPHYMSVHNDSEVYTSRLPPLVLSDLKKNIGNQALYAVPKKPNLTAFHYRCPFCDFQATNPLRCWMEHFTIHTGEYQYKCSFCFKGMNGCTHLMDHIKRFCPGAKKINREPVNLRGHQINGYVCHLCNFTQMLRNNVVRHLKKHHDLEDATSIAKIIEIKLIDSTGVSQMKEASKIESSEEIRPPPSPPNKPKDTNAANDSNMEVFLSRELASPTSDVLTERLRSMDQEDEIISDSSVGVVSPFKGNQAQALRITIAEKLSQRFKNIEKHNSMDEVREGNSISQEEIHTQNQCRTEEAQEHVITPSSSHNAMAIEETPIAHATTDETVALSRISPVVGCSSLDSSFNESGKLVIDENDIDKSTADDDGSGSEWAEDNDEDDNENWEDIEITETKSTCQKDKNKNKSIFQTLSRLYASIAPKKCSKKSKEKEKKKSENSQPTQKPSQTTTQQLLPGPESSAVKPTPSLLPQQISNLSDLLPDSPGDSLDMLLSTNFNCLEGDGTSFPHLDLNDLDSSIFLLPEEQPNIQDAISMVTDSDHIKYDVLGDPLPINQNQTQRQTSSLSVQRIGNIGFSLSGGSLKYYCMVPACTFLFSDHPDGLQNHLLLEHPLLKWNGFCHTCGAQVGFGENRELQHIVEVHSKPRIDEHSVDKPRIKFRRLTGDMLSTGKQISPPPASADPPQTIDFSDSNETESQTPALSLSSLLNSRPRAMIQPAPPPPFNINEKEPKNTALSLSSLLKSRPRAMIQPAPPPPFETDIPLYKNVSKEFAITGVAEGVTDDDLSSLVFNQSECRPGGIQISNVISLNAGGKSLSPIPLHIERLKDLRPNLDICRSPLNKEPHGTLRMPESSSNIPVSSGSLNQNQTNLAFGNTITITKQVCAAPQTVTAVTPKATCAVPQTVAEVSPKPTEFKCGGKNCSFSTSLRTEMNDHLVLHMRTDNDRESLKCHECAYPGRSIFDYFQHMARGHSTTITATATVPNRTTNELTQKIQDILRASAKPMSQTPEEEETDPLALEPQNTSFAERLQKVAEEMVAETGIIESELWKCPFIPECTWQVTGKDFQSHVGRHISVGFPKRPAGAGMQCPHCPTICHRPGILKNHLKSHMRHQFFCYVCCDTFGTFPQAQKHFNETHSRSAIVDMQTFTQTDGSCENPCFVVSSSKLSATEIGQFGEKLIAEWDRKKSLNKTHFQPHEQYLLPIQPIFNNQVFCSVCNYKTKVRTNMFRHLQLHKQEVDVGSVDPVNPVPCLEKNEKHFDKMLNLACSSNVTGVGSKPKESAGLVKIPGFVPDMKRYVCGHPGCKYLTITDNILRSHLIALHSGEKGYQCPHCQEEICKKNICAERVVQHLKFHGQKIYQCGECEYLHYTKHVVERHVNEKHSTVPYVNLVTFDRTEKEVNKTTQLMGMKGSSLKQNDAESPQSIQSSSIPVANKLKWECALCKHQTATWNQMTSHTNYVHHAKHQYQCVHCSFGSAHSSNIMDHIDIKHPSKTREAKYVFYKIHETPQDKAADTRPLWSRDDPKRVRSIRGILMEDEEDAERVKQSLNKAGVDLEDEDDDVEIVQVIESESAMKPGVLGCFHCDFKSKEISSLTNHWRTKHWQTKNNEQVPIVPFFFRIHSILKCPQCPEIGDYVFMQIHAMNKHGQRTFCAADPKLPNTCGHCPFVYPPNRLEVLTRHYHREHKPTDVKNLSSSLLKSVLALGECQVYMQCYFCAEICADKTAIIEHERDRHGSSNFRYKQIKDEVIYRCAMCQYSSTNELATLRHMIDHFGGFKRCCFCMEDQKNFNSYMQHCSERHSKALKDFKEIYTLIEVTAFLGQMLLIFPNGLILNKRNLIHTQYGSIERINAMYDEICKKALEPRIAPLSMARLMARKSIEAKDLALPKPLLPPPSVPVTAKRIAKRRSTVAMGAGDIGLSDFLHPNGPQKIKRRKASIYEDRPPAAPLFSTIVSSLNAEENTDFEAQIDATNTEDEPVGVSFYGKEPEPVDLSKIYTQIAIGNNYAPVSVKKFALLFKMNAKVIVQKMDFAKLRSSKKIRAIHKPCPASKKKRFV